MSVNINQVPANYSLVNNQMIISASSSIYSNTSFQYIFTIYTGSDVTLSDSRTASIVKKFPATTNEGITDIQRVISDSVSLDFDYQTLGWVQNPNKETYYRVQIDESYATNSTITTIVGTSSLIKRAMLGRVDQLDFINWSGADANGNLNGWALNNYLITQVTTASNNYQLSPVYLDEYKVGVDDIGILMFLQELPTVASSDLYPIDRLVLESYDSNDTLLAKVVKAYPYSTSTIQNADNLISIFSGPYQIASATWSVYSATYSEGAPYSLNPIVNADYYLLYVEQSFLNTLSGDEDFLRNSVYYKFRLTNYCDDYFRIGWLNSLSGMDFFNFINSSDTTTNINKNSWNKIQDYNYSVTGIGGTNNYNSKWNKVVTINSDWISQSEALLIEEMFKSNEAFLQVGYDYIPIVIITDSFKKWNDNDDLFFYEFQFTYPNLEFFRN